MSAKLVRTNGIVPMSPAADQTGKEGYFVKVSSGKAAIVSAVTDVSVGVIMYGENTDGQSAIGIPGALAGTVRVKLGAAVTAIGTKLQLKADGSVIPDAGTGDRVLVAKALETGAENELIEAALIEPDAYASDIETNAAAIAALDGRVTALEGA